MHKSKVVNTKRERRSGNNKNPSNNNNHHHQNSSPPNTISKQTPFETLGALVTGLTSTQTTTTTTTMMTDESVPSIEALVIKPTSIEINSHPNGTNGVIHENGNHHHHHHHSPSKSLKFKLGNDEENGHVSNNLTADLLFGTPSTINDGAPPSSSSSSFETPTTPTTLISSSFDEQGNKHDESSNMSSPPRMTNNNHHHHHGPIDSGLSSEVINTSGTETEKTNGDDDSSMTSGVSSSILSAARQFQINHEQPPTISVIIDSMNDFVEQPFQRESSPTSGVIIPEERRVTDRVKVFEAAMTTNNNNNDGNSTTTTILTGKKQPAPKHNGKSSSSSNKPANLSSNSPKREQISPSSSEILETTSTNNNESKVTTTTNGTKNKSKRPSLKKQIQNLLKIDKSSSSNSSLTHEDAMVVEEPTSVSTTNNNKKSNTLGNPRSNNGKRDSTASDSTITSSLKRPSPPPHSSSSSQQNSPNGTNVSKRASPPLSTTTTKRVSPRESPSKNAQHSPTFVAEFNMKPIVEPLEIRIESNSMKKKSPSPSSTGLLTSEIDGRRSGVSKLINSFQSTTTTPHELEQTVLVSRLRSPGEMPTSSSSGASQFDTSTTTGIGGSNSPLPGIATTAATALTSSYSPMSSGGGGDTVKTSVRSVTIESGARSGSNRYNEPGISSLLSHSTNAQVTDNLRVQHQREKQELSELNDRFRGYLDRVKVLEGKNAKLTGQLDEITKAWGAASQAIIAQYGNPLDRLRSEVNDSMIDEADLQTRLRRSHYTIDNYRALINDETAWNDRQTEKREQLKIEFEHSCSELAALQKSYKQVEDQLKNLLKQREDLLSEIDQLNEQSYRTTIDRIKLDLQVQTLREEIPFLNDIHAHLISEFEQLKPTNGIDTQLFYRQELEKAIRDIRRDFEALHNAQRKEMEEYYNVKIEEIQNDAKKLVPIQARQDDLLKMNEQIKAAKFDLNDSQKILINEKETFKQLQERLSKLEEEYSFVRDQRTDASNAINKDLALAQERIQQLTGEIDSILQSNITLESEINVYRRLLDSETNRLGHQTIEQILPAEPAPPSFGSELGKVFNKKIKKGPIAIKDCAPDGKCITLENSSIDKDVDVSNWTLKRRVEGSQEISYTIPFGLTIRRGGELKIYARSAPGGQHRPPGQVVNDKLDSWGMGTECETKLFNEQNEEKASHSQKIVFGSESTRNMP